MKEILLTGDRPTGKLHLGHYVGSLKNRVEMQNSGKYIPYIFIADMQALTDNARNPEKIRRNLIEVALDYLAVGIDPKKKCYICSISDSGIIGTYNVLFKFSNFIKIRKKSHY